MITVKGALKGPTPADVSAAMTQMKVVKGVRSLTKRKVVLEVSWKEPPPATVTLMMKRMMTPLISSAGGRFQVMLAVLEVTAGTLKFSGKAVGAVARNTKHNKS